LYALGKPKLLPTPPFSIGREIALDPLLYKGFMGYEQKLDLMTVQKAILSYLMTK
jgi:ornithine carbamoyltransferase